MLTKSDIDWLKGEFMPDLVSQVKKALSDKLDAIDTKLDTFVTDRFDRIDRHLHISTAE